ncbi:hypothetical protein V6O07_03345, partial [Arthrospira platensis SPKY2]
TIQTTNPASIEKTTSYEELKSDSAKFQSTENIIETASTSTSDKEISTQIDSSKTPESTKLQTDKYIPTDSTKSSLFMTVSDSSSLFDNHLSKETTVFFKSTSMIDNNANTDKLTTLQNELSYETTNTDKIQTNNADTIPVITSKLETSLGDTTKKQNTQSTEILDHTTEHSVTDFSNSITDQTLEISDISSKVSKVSLEYSTRNVENDSTKYKTDDYVETSTIGKFEPRSETIQTT